jgi:hypothetical protein
VRNNHLYDHSDHAAQDADDHWSEHGDEPRAMDDGVSYGEVTPTPPDGWSFIPEDKLTSTEMSVSLMRRRMEAWKPEMTFARWTDMTRPFAKEGIPRGLYLEVWKVQPDLMADFDPPVSTPGDFGWDAS